MFPHFLFEFFPPHPSKPAVLPPSPQGEGLTGMLVAGGVRLLSNSAKRK